MNNTRITLPPESGRQLRILSAYREISMPTLVIELIAREYARLGLDERKDWTAPEAKP